MGGLELYLFATAVVIEDVVKSWLETSFGPVVVGFVFWIDWVWTGGLHERFVEKNVEMFAKWSYICFLHGNTLFDVNLNCFISLADDIHALGET